MIRVRRFFSEKAAKTEAVDGKNIYVLTTEPGNVSKDDLKRYMLSFFDVNVLSVRKIKLPGKKVMFRRRPGKRSERIKYIVKVDKKIDLLTA
jgi:ribosomal protein L23